MEFGLTFYIGIAAVLILLFLGRNLLIGTIRNLAETIVYIYRNGWEEYRKARERYDRHMELQERSKSKYSRVGEVRQRKDAAKKARR